MIYAVNKRTKEHRRDVVVKHPDWVTVYADPDGWIEWQGGECPLPDGFRCDVIHRSGFSSLNRPAGGWAWGRDYEGDDIIAYRPILDTEIEPEPPAWDGRVPPVGAYVEYPTGRGVVKLPPDRDGVTVVEDDGSKCADEAGTYKRVAACACHPLRSEEDIAVEEMERAYRTDPSSPSVTHGMRHLYRAIRDSKIPGVTLEVDP